MNRRTQDREQNYASAAAKEESLLTEPTNEYVTFVDGSNAMQLQKIAMQSSFESRMLTETFNGEED